MKRLIICLLSLLLLLSQSYASNGKYPNLFPNGDVENVFVNQLVQENEYRSRIEAAGTGVPTYWRLSDGAALCKKVKFAGENAIKLSRGEKEVTATIYSDYWKVKDAGMPFGLPLVPGKEINISFHYKTAHLKGKNAFKSVIKLGVIKNLPAQKDSLFLPASDEWKLITREITLSELKWGCEVVFTLPGDSVQTGSVWIDNVCLNQQIDGVNLVKNHSFEAETVPETLPPNWQVPIEDQWVSWVGSRYRKPAIEAGEAISGNQSLRASVTYAEGSGVAQLIPLHQKTVKPVVIDIRSKLDNSIGKRQPYYWGADNYANLTVFVYHQDGTMQEVSPTFLLGESDHDWDYRRFGFMAQKPVKDILLQITILGSEPTTSLWIDDVRAFEFGASTGELLSRGLDLPVRSVSAKWGNAMQLQAKSKITVSNDDENIYLNIPQKSGGNEISIYLNPQTRSAFVNHYRYLFDVIKIAADGQVLKGITVEKQGYSADGEFEPARKEGIECRKKANVYHLTVPFRALGMAGPSFRPFGFNVLWQKGGQKIYWNGKAINNREMGRIILAKVPGVRIKNILFGKRYFYEKDESQDYISYPQIYAGMNEAVITLVNDGPDSGVEITAGIKDEPSVKNQIVLKHAEVKRVTVFYQTGPERLTDFDVTLKSDTGLLFSRTYPIQVPPAIEIVPDQEYYYAEEDTARIEIYNRYRPIPENGNLQIKVTDLREQKTVRKFIKKMNTSVATVPFIIRDFRVNPLPVQDYSVTVTYMDENARIVAEQTKRFGKINHTQRRKLPPIEKLTVDDMGRIVINDNFRFFPVVPSVNIMDWHDAIDLGANMYRSWYSKSNTGFTDRDRAWAKNVYTITIGPGDSKILDQFESQAESLLVHPGFLGCYGKQFYYWNLPPEFINLRKRVEHIVSKVSSPRLVIWGHHDSSFLYDHNLPKWPNSNPPVGYCYVKIMGRPGSSWRNSPFLTRTEQVLAPQRFKLAEVNYYVAFHDDEVVPEHFVANLSLRADDWHGLRNESYLSVIYGANGLYHWICTQKKDLQRLRGWFQELNYMWPVFVADDAEYSVEVLPYDNKVDVRLKKWQGKYYLLTANRDDTTQKSTIRINGLKGMKVKKMFELPEKMRVEDGSIRDIWEKYGTHVYEIEIRK